MLPNPAHNLTSNANILHSLIPSSNTIHPGQNMKFNAQDYHLLSSLNNSTSAKNSLSSMLNQNRTNMFTSPILNPNCQKMNPMLTAHIPSAKEVSPSASFQLVAPTESHQDDFSLHSIINIGENNPYNHLVANDMKSVYDNLSASTNNNNNSAIIDYIPSTKKLLQTKQQQQPSQAPTTSQKFHSNLMSNF
jgi:hypothetical protein